MGAVTPKALIPVAGRPMLAWSVAALADVAAVVVTAPPGHVSEARAIAREDRPEALVIAGGASRAESVAAGLEAIPAEAAVVLVHDAARPLLSPAIVRAVLAAVEGADGAIAARPVADTLKRAEPEGAPVIAATVDRAPLWAAETPQAFLATALRRGVAAARREGRLAAATDCASLVEAIGGRVRLVPTPGPNLKVTTPADLAVAEHLLRGIVRLVSAPVLTDYHMHLQPDGAGARAEAAPAWDADGGHLSAAWIGRYVERARGRAVSEIAITEHVYRFAQARDWNDDPWWREEATEDADAYCAAVIAARDAGLPVLLGIEMDWLPGRLDEIAAFLAARPFDVVLGSVHWIGPMTVNDPSAADWGGRPAEEVWSAYLAELVAAAGSGLYDVLAHPDLPKVFGARLPESLAGAMDEAVAAIAAAGVAIECSSAGLRKPVGELYPEPALLARFREAGVPATLSSDAHHPGDVARDYPTAVAALRGAGYETITRFSRREPAQVPIRWA